MKKTRFSKIIVIGQGKIANDILIYVHSLQNQYGYKLECIVYEQGENNLLGKECERRGIECSFLSQKEKVHDYFKALASSTLVISAFNNYWFPKDVVNSQFLTIINYHNSYLPRYQGGNAITWALYNEEIFGGATWHYVTSKADNGDIIWQEKILISENMKAYELSRKSMEAAYKGFVFFFERLLIENVIGTPQIHEGGVRELFFFSQLPQDGVFNVYDHPKKIYKLLRAMDYGKGSGWKCVKVDLGDCGLAQITSYRIVNMKHEESIFVDYERKYIYIYYQEGCYLKMKFEKVER